MTLKVSTLQNKKVNRFICLIRELLQPLRTVLKQNFYFIENFSSGSSRFIVFSLLLLVATTSIKAANKYSVASGNWNATSTWSNSTGGPAGATAPVAGDIVYIEGGRTVTTTATAACADVNIAAGSALSINGFNFTSTGTTTISGTLTHTSTNASKTFNNVVISGGTWVNNASETYAINSLSLSGATINGSATTSIFNIATTLTVAAATTNTLNGLNLTVTGATTVSGTLNFASTAGNKTFTGLVTINNTGTINNNTVNEALTFQGGITNNGGTLNAGTGVYTFSTNSQALNGIFTIPNVTVTGGAVTLTNNGTLNVSTALTGTGILLNPATGILNLGGTATITTLTATAVGNTVNYNGAAQTAKSTTYNNLILSGSGTKTTTAITVSGILSIEGTASISAAPTWSGTAYTLQYKTTDAHTAGAEWPNPFTGSGGVIIANTAGSLTMNSAEVFSTSVPLTINSGSTLNTANFQLTFGGNFINNGGTFSAGSSAITITGTATQNIAGFTTTGAVSVTKTAGIATLGGNVSASSLTLNGTGGSLNSGISLSHTVSGNVLLTAGTLDGSSSTFNVGGNWTNNGGAFTPSTSTVNFNGSTMAINGTAASQTFNNIVVAKTAGQSLSVGGSTTSLTINGIYSQTTGNFTAPATMLVGTDFTLTSGTFTPGTSLTVNGNWINNSGSTFGSGTVYLTGTTQTVLGSTNTSFNNLTIGNSGLKSFSSLPSVNGIFSMEGSATVSAAPTYGAGATLQYNTTIARTAGIEWINPFNATGGVIIANTGVITLNSAELINAPLTINSGSTLNTNAVNNYALTFGGNFTNAGTFTANASNITITGTGTQNIAGFTTTGGLTCDKSAGVATLTGNVNAASLSNTTLGGTLNLGTGLTHSISGTWTRTNGTLDGGSSTLNIAGNVSNIAGTFTPGTSTVNYTGAAQTTASVNYNNLGLSGSGAKTLQTGTTSVTGNFTLSGTATATAVANVSISGDLNIGTGTSLDLATYTANRLTTGGVLTISGTLFLGGSNFPTNFSSVVTTGGTVNYDNAGIQTIGAVNYNNLILSGSGVKTLQAGTTNITGSLTLSGTATATAAVGLTIAADLNIGVGTSFDAATFTHNIAGNFINSGTFTAGSSTINLNGTTQSLSGASTFNNLTLSGTGTKTFANNTVTNSNFSINSGAVANLGTGLTHSAGALYFATTKQIASSWGGTGSTAININTTNFAASTGVLNTFKSWTGKSSTDWNIGTNWSDGLIPTITDDAIIPNVLNQPIIGASSFCNNLTINSGSSLSITGANNLTVGGNWSNSGTFTANSSTVLFTGSAQSLSGTNTFNNLTLGGTGLKTLTTTPTINGILSMEGTATVSAAPTYGTAATLQYNTATARTAGAEWIATFVASGGVIISNSGAITLNGAKVQTANLSISTGSTLNTDAVNNYALTFGANFTNAGTFTANASNITITGTGTQSIAGFTTTGGLTCTKSAGVATLSGNINAASLTNSTLGGTLNLGTGLTHTISGSWTRTNGTLDGNTSTLNIGGSVSNTAGTFTPGTSTVNYSGAAQTLADVNYYNLGLSGSASKTMGANTTTISGNLSLSGTATATTASALAITGNLTVGTGTSLSTGATNTFTLSVGGISSVNGTLTLANTGNKTFSGDVTLNSGAVWNETSAAAIGFGGNLSNNATTFTANSGTHTLSGATKTLSGTTAFVIPTATFTGSYTNSGTLTSATALTISGAAVTLTNNGTITAGTTLTGTGGLTQGTNAVLNIGGSSSIATLSATAVGNSVNYTGGTQTVFTGNYYNLSLSGTAVKTLQTGTTNIGGSFTLGGTASTTGVVGLSIAADVILGSGTSFTSGAFTHNVAGNWTNNGATFTAGTGTVNFTGNTMAINGTAATQNFNNIIVAKTAGQTLSVGGSTTTLTTAGTFTETSGNFTAPASMSVTGNFTLTAGTFTAGALLNSAANWTNNGATFTAGTGTVNLNGTTQTVSGSAATIFNNLTISTSGLKTLTTVPTVNAVFSISGTATVSVAPTYNTAATLQYNTTTARAAGVEWISPFVATGGIIIGSTGTITLNAAKVLNSTSALTINSGASLANSTFLLTLNGNFINNGGTTSGTGGVTITGTATQSIGSFTNTGTVSMTKSAGTATFTGNVNAANLTINGTGGTLDLGVGLTHTFTGIVTLTAGTLNGGSSILNENATSTTAWNGTGSLFNAGTGTVNFGGVAQTLAASTTTFNNLTFSGGGVKTLGSSINVNGTLTLTSGVVTLGANNLTMGLTSPAVSGTFTATNMIDATSTGEFRKLFNSNSTYLFPVGDLTGTAEYSPMTINFSSGTYAAGAYLGVRVTNSKHPSNTSILNYLNRYWSVSQSGISSFSASVTGNYVSADIAGTETSQVAARYSGSLPWYIYSALGSNTLSATGVTNFGDFTGLNNVPVISSSVPSLTGFTYPVGYGPSTAQPFTISGSGLTSNVTVIPSSSFEISTGTGASFVASSSITIPVTSGNVYASTIYVRMKTGLALGAVAAENIIISATGAASINVACSGTVAVAPVISTGTMSGSFSYAFTAGPSAERTFTVGGTNLTGSLTVTAPADYEISTGTGASFVATNPIILTPTTGTVAVTTLYARLKFDLGVGTYAENIVTTTTDATAVNIACSGTVTPAPTLLTDKSSLAGFIYATGTGPSGIQQFILMGSNLGTNNVTVTPPANFEIMNPATSTYTTAAFTITPSAGSINATLNSRMVSGLAANTYGPANVSLTCTGAVIKTVALSGKVVGTATLLSSKLTVTGFGYMYGTGPSAEQSFTVSGAGLGANNISVTPPANFEISTTTGTGFQSTAITLTQTSGRVNPTTIYVRLKSALATGNYTGVNIVVAATGATSLNISCVGIVFVSPLVTAGGGGTYCEGSTINLTSAGADIVNRYWQGPNSFYSTLQNPVLSTSATSAMTGTYTVTGNVYVGGNLVTNGDFEAGNTSFGSSYLYTVPGTSTTWPNGNLWPEGYYTVDANPNTSHSNFSACPDHTTGGATPVGKQMIINGASVAGVVIWSQSVPVVPNASYEFSYWVQTVVATSPSQLQLYVNGVAAGPTYTADTGTCTWKQFVYNHTAGASTYYVNLELINQNTIANGNDFALDDIVFKQILPATSTTNVTVNPALPVSVSIVASSNPIYSNTPVTFTATPVNGGTAPAYQWKLKNGTGTAVNVGTNSATFTTSTLINLDSVYCVLTSNYACPLNNPATSNKIGMTVTQRLNYWYGYIDTDWGKAGNWTANYVPLTGDDVEYATVANWGSTAINDLWLDKNRTIGSLINATTKKLVLPATKGLEVNNYVTTDGNSDRIWIKTSTTLANGSMHFNQPTYNNAVNATIEMYSRASWDLTQPINSKYKWQYFGIPLRSVVAYPTFTGSYVRKWVESGNSITNHWIQLANDSVLKPFYGYEICQAAPTTIYFKGTIETRDFSSGQMPFTTSALYPGQNVYANSYTAGIAIKNLDYGSTTENTAYLYNTGTYNQWVPNSQTSGYSTGQYVSVPKNLAGLLGLPAQVASMQSILIKAQSNSSTSTFGIRYLNTVVDFDSAIHRIKGINANPFGENEKISTVIDLTGNKTTDRLWLVTEPSSTRNFDNGWDGSKFLGSALSPQLYAIEADGKYQVNTVPDINDTQLGFLVGEDTEYKLTFTHTNIKTIYAGIYLVDKLDNKTIDVTESGSEYSFSATSANSLETRFKIVVRHYEQNAPDTDTKIKLFSSNSNIFVQNTSNLKGDIMVFDIAGHYVRKEILAPNSIVTIHNVIPGAYVVKAITGSEEVTKRLIVR